MPVRVVKIGRVFRSPTEKWVTAFSKSKMAVLTAVGWINVASLRTLQPQGLLALNSPSPTSMTGSFSSVAVVRLSASILHEVFGRICQTWDKADKVLQVAPWTVQSMSFLGKTRAKSRYPQLKNWKTPMARQQTPTSPTFRLTKP